KQDIEIAAPPEFKGHEGMWTPEDLYVAAASSCILFAFMSIAQRKKLEIALFKSEATGKLEIKDGKALITEINIKLDVKAKKTEDSDMVAEIVKAAEKNCLISNSMTAKVTVELGR
ncbi:MAG: OsmC family protein, partial [Candidatus Aureabacteria bacterium]|nr:OsmC family protein [Candidatus Auribacterota bacterium]